MNRSEDILRRKFHGFSDEQWEELKTQFPYVEMPFAMREIAWQAWEELRRQIEEQEYEGVPKYDEYKEKELFELWFNKQIS